MHVKNENKERKKTCFSESESTGRLIGRKKIKLI
jgi:hypothetical protein